MQIQGTIFNAELEEMLEELRSELIANELPYFSKGFKQSGDSIQMQCPYHSDGQEKRPSAGIRKSDGKFHCFTCQTITDLPDVISYVFGHDDILGKFGWNWLLKNFATLQVEERKGVKLDFSRPSKTDTHNSVSSMQSLPSDRLYVDEEELEKYRYIHPYMYERGLTNDIIDLFDIGYDRDTRSITFPIRDIAGRCLFVARRSIDRKFYNYPEGVEKPLYGLYEIWWYYKNTRRLADEYFEPFPNEVIICEGMFDALYCWTFGKKAVALNGLGNGLQFKQLNEMPTRKFIIATDNDEAGEKAAKRIKKNIQNKIVTQYILPDGKKDINSLSEKEFHNLEEVF